MCAPVPGEAGLVKPGPPSVSDEQGARGSLPTAVTLSEHHSPFSSGSFLNQLTCPRSSLLPAKKLSSRGSVL